MSKWAALAALIIMLALPSMAMAETTTLSQPSEQWSYVALGDSLAFGIQNDGTIGKSYADYISADLDEENVQHDFTKQFAIPGAATGDVLDQLKNDPKVKLAVSKADLLTITVGANDFLNVLKSHPEDLQDPVKVQELMKNAITNYSQILGMIRQANPHVQIYIMGYYNSFYALPAEQQQPLKSLLLALNQSIELLANQPGVWYVPTLDAFEGHYSEYLPNPQNVHPNQDGYKTIASQFFMKIENHLPVQIHRIAGNTRYQTAVEISKNGWETADTVVIATGNNFPDALAGVPLAYKYDAPILLTNKRLSASVTSELQRLHAKKAIILGGPNAVSGYTEDQLEGMGMEIQRIAGEDRFETAAFISAFLHSKADTAVVVNGLNFPDALSSASYAGEQGYPILLTRPQKLSEDVKKSLKSFKRTIVVGGSGVVSNELVTHLPNPERYGGSDRYETSAMVATQLNPSHHAFMATGENFADALTGSVLAAKRSATFLLVPPNKIDDSIIAASENLGIHTFTILGGEKAVSPNVEKNLMQLKK